MTWQPDRSSSDTMRIGNSLPHWLQNVAAVLWIIGLGLNFVAAISPIWGWSSVLGWVSSAVLVAFAVDERKGIRASLACDARRPDRLFALYLLVLPSAAVVINAALLLAR